MIHQVWNPHDEGIEQRRRLLGRPAALAGCSQNALEELVAHMTVRVRPRDTILQTQDEPADAAYFIGSGHVRLFLFDDRGREINVAQLGAGDFFGESALFEGIVPSTTALSTDPVMLLRLTRETFLTHVERHPRSVLQLAAELHRRANAAHRAVGELAFQTVERRLVETLRRWGLAHGAVFDGVGLLLRRRPSHLELAQMIGSSRETITRAFSSLKARRLLVQRSTQLWLTRALLDSCA
jgi:CRP/FNR family cyclic AMP-dependent transcriptional regulator